MTLLWSCFSPDVGYSCRVGYKLLHQSMMASLTAQNASSDINELKLSCSWKVAEWKIKQVFFKLSMAINYTLNDTILMKLYCIHYKKKYGQWFGWKLSGLWNNPENWSVVAVLTWLCGGRWGGVVLMVTLCSKGKLSAPVAGDWISLRCSPRPFDSVPLRIKEKAAQNWGRTDAVNALQRWRKREYFLIWC